MHALILFSFTNYQTQEQQFLQKSMNTVPISQSPAHVWGLWNETGNQYTVIIGNGKLIISYYCARRVIVVVQRVMMIKRKNKKAPWIVAAEQFHRHVNVKPRGLDSYVLDIENPKRKCEMRAIVNPGLRFLFFHIVANKSVPFFPSASCVLF